MASLADNDKRPRRIGVKTGEPGAYFIFWFYNKCWGQVKNLTP